MAFEIPVAGKVQATQNPGGLFVISERLPYLKSLSLGFAFRLGSRDDPAEQKGTAHLIEHMIFKGTNRLNARAINILAESLGAELNAFTDKEATCFYGRAPVEKLPEVANLLVEILSEPAFLETDLTKEKGVVNEEIRSSEEDPESCVVNLLLQALYGDTPLGRPVVGTVDSVAQITGQHLRHFYRQHYGTNCAVAVVVGAVEHQRVVDLLAGLNQNSCQTPIREREQLMPQQILVRTRRELSQVYVCLAYPAFSSADPRRYALSVLNTALGGGVSSRLFQRLREEEGLVYSIGSFVELYEDSGLLGIYFVAEAKKLTRCIAVLKEEIARLREEKVTQEEFERALTMTRSALILGSESSINRMMRLARSYLVFNRVTPLEEAIEVYNRLNRDEVAQLVEEILKEDSYYAGVVGPGEKKEIAQVLRE